jgi:MFS family permease
LSFKLESNIKKIYLFKFFRMFMVLMAVLVPFFESKGLSMSQIYLLQSIFAFTVFVFEIPSGYLSDLMGRKSTLIVSSLLSGIGFLLFPLAQGFPLLAWGEVILALSVSLSSGTDTSLLYDTMEDLGSKRAHIKILGKSMFYSSIGETVSALIASGFILFVNLNQLAYISAFLSWIPLIIAFTFVEPSRNKMDKSKHVENIKYIYSGLFQHSKLLNLIILNTIFYTVATLFAVWMFQKYWQNLHIPIIYFGYLWALTNLAVALSAKYAHKVEKRVGSATSLAVIGLLPIVSYLGLGMIESIFGILFCLLFQVCRGFYRIILTDALNKRVTGDFRATANSVVQMGSRVLFMCLGPLVGQSIDTVGISATALYLGGIYIVVFLSVMLPLLMQKDSYIPIMEGHKKRQT